MANYFCHECNRRVTVNNALQCENCRGEFVEEIFSENEQVDTGEEGGQPRAGGMLFVQRDGDDADQGRTFIFEGQNPFESMLQANNPFGRLFGQILNQPSRDRNASTSQRPDTPHVDHEDELSNGHRITRSAQQANPMGDGLMQFFNQLMANLAENGNNPAHLTFHVNNGGDGEGTPIFQPLHGNLNDYAWGEGGIDHIVTQLLNQFDGSREENIRAEDLSRLPMAEVTAKQVENGTQCATCMDTFVLNERVAKLECEHIFHRVCIEPWLKKRNTCPICRKVVDPKNWGPELKISDVDELD